MTMRKHLCEKRLNESILIAPAIYDSQLRQELMDGFYRVAQDDKWGFPNQKEIDDILMPYLDIYMKDENQDEVFVELRAEFLDYDEAMDMAAKLNPILTKYDKNAYFDMVEPGVLGAVILNKAKKENFQEGFDMISDMEKYLTDLQNSGVNLNRFTASNKLARRFPSASNSDIAKVIKKLKIRESETVAESVSEADIQKLMKAAVNVQTKDELDKVISSLKLVDKDKFLHYSELTRDSKYSPAAIGKMISDDLYYLINRDDINESISDDDFQQKLKNELQGRLQAYYKKLGYTQREIEDYIMPVYKTKLKQGYGEDGSDALFVWVGAEVNYNELANKLAPVLNKVVQKYDKEAYFEPETTGRLMSVLWDRVDESCKESKGCGMIDVLGDIKESVEDNDRYEKIKTKTVYDSDGFRTDYTLYFDHNQNNYFTIFGDSDLYGPDSDHDWDFGKNEKEALEWFEDYEGFTDEPDFDVYSQYDDIEPYEGGVIKNEWKFESLNEARKPKYYDTMFGYNVIKDFKNGKLTLQNIPEWDKAYNGGKIPNPPFNTKQIIDYYLATNKELVNEKLIQSDSQEAFEKNVATEIKAGKPVKQALAIAYSVKRRNKDMKEAVGRGAHSFIVEFNDDGKKGWFVAKADDEDQARRLAANYGVNDIINIIPLDEGLDDWQNKVRESLGEYRSDGWSEEVADRLEDILTDFMHLRHEILDYSRGTVTDAEDVYQLIQYCDRLKDQFDDILAGMERDAEELNEKVCSDDIDEGKEIFYVIKDRQGNQLSAPSQNDLELWDRVESMDPFGDKGFKVVVVNRAVND